MKHKLNLLSIILLFALIISLSCTANSQVKDNVKKTYVNTSNYSFKKIDEIKNKQINAGLFNTEGYVVKIYTCPPCPPDVNCKPCMRDNIVISENNIKLDTYTLTNKEIIIFADNVDQFIKGHKYKFSINISNQRSTGEPINDIELKGYDPIER